MIQIRFTNVSNVGNATSDICKSLLLTLSIFVHIAHDIIYEINTSREKKKISFEFC